MTALPPSGFLRIGAHDLEYRMIGPAPSDAPTIVMLHEGLGSAALWGDFPQSLQAATGMGVFVYSRAGYGASTPAAFSAACCSAIPTAPRSRRSMPAVLAITASVVSC